MDTENKKENNEEPSSFERARNVVANISQYIAGNRIALATIVANAASVIVAQEFLPLAATASAGMLGSYSYQTNFSYQRTKKHILRFGKIDKRFFETMMREKRDNAVSGYCTLQGMYLAAKESGLEDSFFSMKKGFTQSIVPNF